MNFTGKSAYRRKAVISMKTVLAFGDSNTYGLNPCSRGGERLRFDSSTRWTGLLASRLAPHGWQVAEEGLCGRTTVFTDPHRDGLRGADALPDALAKHNPDAVILMLGTNDCKTAFRASPCRIAEGIETLIGIIRAQSHAEILLMSPILLGEEVYAPDYDPDFDAESVACSKGLRQAYAETAARLGCAFLAASDYAAPSETDREHMDAAGHRALADAVFAAFSAQFL